MKIGCKVSKPIKLDVNTSLAIRGKFAKICVEVDLSKPLVSRVRVGNFIQIIEYEAMYTVCFKCGVYGHRMDKCPLKQSVPSQDQNVPCNMDVENNMDNSNSTCSDYGPWMFAHRRTWCGSNSKGMNEIVYLGESQGNRFSVFVAYDHDDDIGMGEFPNVSKVSTKIQSVTI
ncbi:hypothetical protein REPUB_Repub03eG0063800 [Reevesia pubescens]